MKRRKLLIADDYFTKPVSVHYLARRITRLLESRE
jgi:DNA-binding response OmpR family regulator